MTTPAKHADIKLRELLAGWINAEEADQTIKHLTMDSRQVEADTLFIACSGVTHHGLEFLQQAIDRGAVAVVCEPDENWSVADITTLAESVSIPLYPLADLSTHVSAIAGRFYGDPSQTVSVVGITGTNGKTSCSHYLAQVFSPEHVCGVIGTVGNGLLGSLEDASHTTPDAVKLQAQLKDLKSRGADMVAMEVSSHALDQGRAAAVSFDVAVLTNLTQDHLDYHQTMQSYADAKKRLFFTPGLNCAVLNLDDQFSARILESLPQSVRKIGYTATAANNDQLDGWINAAAIIPDCKGMSLSIESSWGAGHITSRLLGRFNVSNMLAVLAVMLYRGIVFEVALEKLSRLKTVAGRMECFGGGNQPLVVVDYAHTPDALEQALIALREHVGGRLVCVFGCGGDRDRAKRPIMGAIAERLADQVIVTDDNPRSESGEMIIEDILSGMQHSGEALVMRNRADAIAKSITKAMSGDLILVAGKGHEAYQLVGDQVLHFSDREQVQKTLAGVKA
ncbi:UDP-N-acetylmuramoyl-L-alanyl-D-glutamate--2,6-diaminopimelate ligase [Sedimenticola selenatireducens]|uniref:UDP-N-acetylmuramoyl-L-alanyl-D-glutamate--2,6-diaminopimelate ligase n=1 Tax=Sedimenticola selenatireducens TaxID=191960 RepID=A0A557S064_9GAMM|nr:UDP-N-acetylmuramoyl-L-alanyl-D-glutamate--2,6-diaminopimelate ligase [Sedimenticola selenatireducens]TVO70800.1 UDP-N-acetylmuramoyl-L-alanyl-D-glutamate--2,6-diaminopimelate ligase [Sedimenticola selenatireducens]TVT65720.1 MAG: UDP-N-acetylmuramoyl-L-alanyl-D-glutamate--2,6-diaminopimelate ligase [Sedimenticola selenatireducens]